MEFIFSILAGVLGNAVYAYLQRIVKIILSLLGIYVSHNILLTSYPKPNKGEVKGRIKDLKKLRKLLRQNKDVLLLSGMGGIGKTTLAARYVQKKLFYYNHIAWINTSQGFYEAFAFNNELIKSLGSEKKLQQLQQSIDPKDYPIAAYTEIIHQLNQKNGKLLLVIDNALEGQPLQTLRDGLKRNWKLLVTAREPLGSFTQYAVGILQEGAAIELFVAHYTRENDKALIKEILQRVAYHTLSIELIAKTAQQKNGYSLKQLKADMESKGLTLAKGIAVKTKYNQKGGHEEYRTHIMECLHTAFDVAQLGDNEDYVYTLKNLCVLPTTPMPFEFICGLLGVNEEEDKNQFNTVLNELVAKGWVEKIEEDYKLHPVLQETLQNQLQPQPKEVTILVDSLANLLHADEKSHPIEKVPYIPYTEDVLTYFFNGENFSSVEKNNAWESIAILANNLSLIYKAKGDLEQALRYQKKALEIKEKVLDENHPNLAASYNNLSTIYQDKRDLENALSYQKKAIEIAEKVFDNNDPSLATSYNNLSAIYKDKGDLEKALSYQKKALEIKEKVLDENDPSLATSYNNLSNIYQDKGDLENALGYQIKAIEVVKEVLDENHPNLGVFFDNLAGIYTAMGQTEKAAVYHQKSQAIAAFNKQRGWG